MKWGKILEIRSLSNSCTLFNVNFNANKSINLTSFYLKLNDEERLRNNFKALIPYRRKIIQRGM